MRMGDGWGDDAYLARQPFFRDYPRLLVYETGVHFIDTFRFLLGEVTSVFANLRRLNPGDQGRGRRPALPALRERRDGDLGRQPLQRSRSRSPRFTFGQHADRRDGRHLTMDTESTIRIKRSGSPAATSTTPRENVNFAGDCVYFLQRHFVDCMLSGREFESNGRDYLETIRVVDAAYESARAGQNVRVGGALTRSACAARRGCPPPLAAVMRATSSAVARMGRWRAEAEGPASSKNASRKMHYCWHRTARPGPGGRPTPCSERRLNDHHDSIRAGAPADGGDWGDRRVRVC